MRILRQLLGHMEWADRLVLESLRSGAAPPRAVELYAHVLGAEQTWLSRIEQRASKTAVWPSLTREECALLAADNIAGFTRLLDSLDGADLAREVPYTNSAGRSFRSRVDDILLQVFLHGQYHRGQVAPLIRGAELDPVATDYIGYVRGAPAATLAAAADHAKGTR